MPCTMDRFSAIPLPTSIQEIFTTDLHWSKQDVSRKKSHSFVLRVYVHHAGDFCRRPLPNVNKQAEQRCGTFGVTDPVKNDPGSWIKVWNRLKYEDFDSCMILVCHMSNGFKASFKSLFPALWGYYTIYFATGNIFLYFILKTLFDCIAIDLARSLDRKVTNLQEWDPELVLEFGRLAPGVLLKRGLIRWLDRSK